MKSLKKDKEQSSAFPPLSPVLEDTLVAIITLDWSGIKYEEDDGEFHLNLANL